MKRKDFISLLDYSSDELTAMIDLANQMKKNPEDYRESLKGKSLGMIFAKNSTRTRISFQVGIYQLGGTGLFFGSNDLQLSRGETIYDTAKVLSRYLDGIMIRTFDHNDVLELAKHATIPVINGLTDYNHPCQAMADIMTIREKFGKDLQGLKLAYVGDGNNVTLSTALVCSHFGMDFVSITPKAYSLFPEAREQIRGQADKKQTKVAFTDNVDEGMKDVHVVYTDTWTSMGQEAEKERRLKDLADYQVNDRLMKLAHKKAIFMHCLPAHREEEMSTSVIDGPQSVVFDQAENRLHAQKAIMYTLMK